MSVLTTDGQAAQGRQTCLLPMDRIVPNPRQPRKAFDEWSLTELASSIRQHGLLQPITVRACAAGYEIVMGERRYRACAMLGYTEIEAFILPIGPGESALLALIENLQRENLHYFEEAEAYQDLLSQGATQEQLAVRLGRSASAIANKLRLLKLEPEVRACLREEGLSERHARALISLPPGPARLRIARQAAQQHLTVRETEALVVRAQRRLPAPPESRRVISVAYDRRLYVNAIRNVIRQMQETGLDARMELSESEDSVDVRIRIGKT